jgi:4-aminobutyrate aminotransferase-like enzyme
MAQAATGKTGIIATDATYHGNTMAVSQLSTRKPPIGGRWPNVRLVPAPDSVRRPDPDGSIFADHVAQAVQELDAAGFGCSGILLCPMFANEGLPSLPPGWLNKTVDIIRAAGGIVISDEVQPGFGRAGSHFWGHDKLGFAPDVVVMGKPMANGHPVGAVATRPDVMAAFRTAFSYFNTFGGNPVSAAAALAVLDVIRPGDVVDVLGAPAAVAGARPQMLAAAAVVVLVSAAAAGHGDERVVLVALPAAAATAVAGASLVQTVTLTLH